jgi:hypothetical protein
MKELLRREIETAKVSGAGLLIMAVLGQISPWLFILLIPFSLGYFSMKNLRRKDVLNKAFWFMAFNLVFGVVVLFLFGRIIYLDVLFPLLFFYVFASPLMFSLGGLIKGEKTFALAIFFFLLFAAGLLVYRSHLTIVVGGLLKRNYDILYRFFAPYDVFLIAYQFWMGLRRLYGPRSPD